MRVEVVAELDVGVTAAAVERVAHEAAPARIGRVDPEWNLVRAQMAVEIEVADAGLDEARLVARADVQDAVHALQIEDDAARIRGCRAAVRQVAARRDRIQREAVLIRNL